MEKLSSLLETPKSRVKKMIKKIGAKKGMEIEISEGEFMTSVQFKKIGKTGVIDASNNVWEFDSITDIELA